MAFGYDMLYAAAAVLGGPVWAWRLARRGKWRTDWRGRFGGVPVVAGGDDRPTLLIHAVSVGEVSAIAPLVGRIDALTQGAWRIVISVTTDTGFARACDLFEPGHRVVRYPFDLSGSVRRFLDRVDPDLVALAELEVWPNFLDACARRGVPVCVVTGRLSDRSFKRYRLVRRLVRRMFAQLTAAAVQTPGYATRFAELGTPRDRIHVLDSMKWDTTPKPTGHAGGADALAAAMGIDRGRPLIVAGSTGPGEERLLIDTCPRGAGLLLAPRRPERFDQVAGLAANITRRSERPDGTPPPKNPSRIMLLDTIGDLATAYALADVAIVGRSFLGLFGSNPLEPIALGKPTIIGPHHADFADIVTALRERDGVLVTADPGSAAGDLLGDPDRAKKLADHGRAVLEERRGATDRHVELLQRLMPGGGG